MSAEDIITSIVLGFVGGLLIFTAIVVSRRGKPWSLPPPRHAEDRSDDDRRQASSAPLTPIGSGWFRPLAVLLSLDRLYVLGARLVLIAMVLYSAFVVPRLRWVLLGALSTLTLLFFLWHFVAGLLRGRNKV
ncbi:MAG: hypothetical protein AUI47_06335 [Acidobacteria bacterium 13_1_40CM_2_68_5]|nr:MAG: hypothetical protein AUI47_06335 [Acidobacteria bacterium 13_1_40CM_2_68_5]